MAGGEEGPVFQSTPSWIIGATVFVMVAISLVLEKLLCYLGQTLKRKDKKPLKKALKKIKEELMLMGFVSLLLAVFQDHIKHQCISEKLAQKWHPCHNKGLLDKPSTNNTTAHFQNSISSNTGRRLLADNGGTPSCKKFSFFKHLIGKVTKADYAAIRLGFILAHCDGNQMFNFHNYMVYAYEADFQKVVSISWYLWLFAVISLSLNVAGWNIYFWLSFIPLFLLLIVGTKLEQVITELAIHVAQRHTVIVGDIRIQPSDEYFWFNRPKIFLKLIHVILFLNSFGLAILFWSWIKFRSEDCVMGDPKYIVARIIIMLVVLIICSYSTLPLYAVVTQMGSSNNKEAMSRYSYASTHSSRVPEETSRSVEMANQ